MAEVGLVKFAAVALEIASAAVPRYRTSRSKHVFTQPQLLALLLLMRYEDWTFREAEVRLKEHSDLRQALGLVRVPDHTALYKFMRRLDERVLDGALEQTVRLMPPPPSGGAVVAVDTTGLEACSVSTYFVRRFGGERSYKHFLTYGAAVDTRTLTIRAQTVSRGPGGDSKLLPVLVKAALRCGPVGVVVADAGFDSHANHRFIREKTGALSVIRPGKGRPGDGAHGVRAEMKSSFPKKVYGRRSLIETVFSMIKRKLSPRAPGRLEATRRLQALLLGVAFNVYRLKLCLFTRPQQLHTSPAQTAPQ